MLALLPEITLAVAALYFFFKNLGLFKVKSQHAALFFGAAAAAASIIGLFHYGEFFSGAYRVDGFSRFFTLLICLSYMIASIIFTRLKECDSSRVDEFYFFISIGALGLVMTVGAMELISMFIAIEISSYPMYIITTFRKGLGRQFEASVKYIIFGAVSTALMLYGISYIYGLSGSTFLVEVAEKLPTHLDNPMAALGALLFMAGLGYKLAAFPFHFWAPDVYSGAASEVTTFIAALPKISATALIIRIGYLFLGIQEIPLIISVLAALSMTLGNLMALNQTGIKRLLAYSAVSHAGFILMGLVSLGHGGAKAAMFYASIYALMSLAAFMIVVEISGHDPVDIPIKRLKGLWHKSPVLAVMLTITLASLAGLPPTAGFIGKLFLLISAWKAGFDWFVIVGVINTFIGIYYYLKIIKTALVSDSSESHVEPTPLYLKATSVVITALIIILGIFPEGLLDLAGSAIKALGL